MNFGESEDFFTRHKYFFDEFSFKFEGFSGENEKELIDTVKKLSGDVSKDGKYTICDIVHYRRQRKSQINSDYYSVKFIDDCISKNQILNIKDYKFHDEKENISIKQKSFPSSLKSFSVFSDIHNLKKRRKESPQKENTKKIYEVINLSSDESEDVHTEIPKKINIFPKNVTLLKPPNWKKRDYQDHKNLRIQSNRRAGMSNKIDVCDEGVVSPKKPSAGNDDDKDNDDDDDDDNDDDDDDDDDNNDNDDIVLSFDKKWWKHLPEPSSKTDIASANEKRSRRKKNFSASEQKLMISFLIKYKMIEKYFPSSRAQWEEMHKKGYLLHRSVESLSNHYRRSILPNIKNYKLPEKYEKKFFKISS